MEKRMQLALNLRLFSFYPRAGWMRRVSHPVPGQAISVPRADPPAQVLAKNGSMVLSQPKGRVVECLEGCLWITLDGEVRDVVIEGGQRFCPDSNRRALIQALKPSRVCVAHVG